MGRIALVAWIATVALSAAALAPTFALLIEGYDRSRLVGLPVLAAGLAPVCVVVGDEADGVRSALAGRALEFVTNATPEVGLSSSLRAGLESLTGRVDGVLVCLGDMPWVPAEVHRSLLEAFAVSAGQEICVPQHAGRRGNPVLWPASDFSALKALSGDQGARALLDAGSARLRFVPVSHPGVLRDVDAPADLDEIG